MEGIGDYLKKFSLLIQGGSHTKELIIQEVKSVVGIDISKEAVEFKQGKITLKVSPAIKSAVYIKKQLLLSKLNEKGCRAHEIV